MYTHHWVACFHKKKNMSDAKIYRGVYMTARFAKLLEKFIGLIFPTLSRPQSIGRNQFACTKQQGARDAIAYLVLSWLAVFKERASMAFYMSGISGAFD